MRWQECNEENVKCGTKKISWRERDREGGGQREKQRQADRKRHKDRDTETNTEIDRGRHGYRDRERYIQRIDQDNKLKKEKRDKRKNTRECKLHKKQ